MKNIITALNNPDLNIALKNEKNINIINKDIIYREGIIEILELKKEVNLIIINYELPGKIKINELINKIKKINEKIEIIFILEKSDVEKEKMLKKCDINNIYFNNKINKEELINIINKQEKTKEEELQEEIEKLKSIIEKNNLVQENKNNIKEKSKRLIKEDIESKANDKKERLSKYKYEELKNIILIEKTLEKQEKNLSIDILEQLKEKNKKILLVDLKIGYEDLHIILKRGNALNQIYHKIKKEGQKLNQKYSVNLNEQKINRKKEKNFFIKINKNTKLLTGLKYMFENNNSNQVKKTISMIKKYIPKYDYLIIEILDKNKQDLNKEIIKQAKKIILILSNDFYSVKNTKLKIEKYKKINNSQILLFINKNKFNLFKSENINIEIIKEIFQKIKIIKKINKYTIKKIIN